MGADGAEGPADVLCRYAAVMAGEATVAHHPIDEKPLGMPSGVLAVAVLAAVVRHVDEGGMWPRGVSGVRFGRHRGGMGGVRPILEAMTGDAQSRAAVVQHQK